MALNPEVVICGLVSFRKAEDLSVVNIYGEDVYGEDVYVQPTNEYVDAQLDVGVGWLKGSSPWLTTSKVVGCCSTLN